MLTTNAKCLYLILMLMPMPIPIPISKLMCAYAYIYANIYAYACAYAYTFVYAYAYASAFASFSAHECCSVVLLLSTKWGNLTITDNSSKASVVFLLRNLSNFPMAMSMLMFIPNAKCL